MTAQPRHHCDIAIVGGGISGLWALNRLAAAGYHCQLLTTKPLGAGQTIASQGMLHGGQKYRLPRLGYIAASRGLAREVASAAARWHHCLAGRGELDLRRVRLLSPHHDLLAQNLTERLAARLATGVLHARAARLQRDRWPAFFRAADGFRGTIWRLPEAVVEVASLLEVLAAPHDGQIRLCHSVTPLVESGQVRSLAVTAPGDGKAAGNSIALHASRYLFVAGAGNEGLLTGLGLSRGAAQRRPLRQLMVQGVPHPWYGHALGSGREPRFTVTAHPGNRGDGTWVWYLGGALATRGLADSDERAIARGVAALTREFPWIDWAHLEWATCTLDRAEPAANHATLPGQAQLLRHGNAAIGWPVKLTLAPTLADRALHWLGDQPPSGDRPTEPLPLPTAPIAPYPWQTANWRRPVT